MRCRPLLPHLLPPGTVTRWHEAALAVLEQVGLGVPDGELARRLANCPGVSLREGRAFLDPSVVEGLVDEVCQRAERPATEPATDRITLHVGSHAHHYVDPLTDELRPFLTDGLVTATRLVDALSEQGVIGSAPGVPQDVPPPLQGLAQMRIGCLHSRHGGCFANAGSLRQARWLRRMAEAAGQAFCLGVHLVSPLQFAGNELDVALALMGEGLPVGVGSMPMMGATAPQSFAGAAIQAMAEAMGGHAALRLLGARQVSFGVNLYAFDHRHATLVYGSPEQNLCDAVQWSVNRYYGATRPTTRSIRSMSQAVDEQSSAERAASAVFGALLGSRDFAGAGLLSLDEVFSPLQLVLDREIADYAQRVAQGVALDEPDGWVKVIAQAAPRGTYLDHESTVGRFRAECWMPRLFEHDLLEAWRHRGSRSALDKTREMTRELMTAETYVCPPERAEAVGEVYEAACRELLCSGEDVSDTFSDVGKRV